MTEMAIAEFVGKDKAATLQKAMNWCAACLREGYEISLDDIYYICPDFYHVEAGMALAVLSAAEGQDEACLMECCALERACAEAILKDWRMTYRIKVEGYAVKDGKLAKKPPRAVSAQVAIAKRERAGKGRVASPAKAKQHTWGK
jgi:hypothetical protein